MEALQSAAAESLNRTRRNASRLAGALGAGAALIVSGCGSEERVSTEVVTAPAVTVTVPAKTGAAQQAPAAPVGQKVLVPGSQHREEQQATSGADTFKTVEVTGVGPHIDNGETVIVDCVATGPVEAATSANGTWYHLVAPKSVAGLYVASNTFWNVKDHNTPFDEQPPVDPSVPPCPQPGK